MAAVSGANQTGLQGSGYYAPRAAPGTQGSGYYATGSGNVPDNRMTYNSNQGVVYGQTGYGQTGYGQTGYAPTGEYVQPVRNSNPYPPVYDNYSRDEVNCPNWLLGLLALLAITGIILGILFGAGVIGGRNADINQPHSSWGTAYPAAYTNGTFGAAPVDYSPYTVVIETYVVNKSATNTRPYSAHSGVRLPEE